MKVGGVQGNQPVKAKASEETTDKDKKFSALLEQKKKQSWAPDRDAPDLESQAVPPAKPSESEHSRSGTSKCVGRAAAYIPR